ncbi:hypothetical protein P280DRAFT_285472 [Massarina eburnea CBS 473.64]|uniref:Uncharacterized protein n=1 Tax=Massarina eburnea CBS 473.64 TaxID=1395130 RepID=A0A6A6S1R4_9PLEO|nr:hypothetical protein P280DRAFT_285472 [Massarina eburnea CBS 473.64]
MAAVLVGWDRVLGDSMTSKTRRPVPEHLRSDTWVRHDMCARDRTLLLLGRCQRDMILAHYCYSLSSLTCEGGATITFDRMDNAAYHIPGRATALANQHQPTNIEIYLFGSSSVAPTHSASKLSQPKANTSPLIRFLSTSKTLKLHLAHATLPLFTPGLVAGSGCFGRKAGGQLICIASSPTSQTFVTLATLANLVFLYQSCYLRRFSNSLATVATVPTVAYKRSCFDTLAIVLPIFVRRET